MSDIANPSVEFSLPQPVYNRGGPARWVFSHSAPYWPIWGGALIGALGNAGMAAVVPVLIGQALNVISAPSPNSSQLVQIALMLGISQVVRGILMLGRNFGFELLAQKVERDVRNELYVSLLGKSMTFHNLQPVGDTMARATNDVRQVNFLFSPGVNMVIGSLDFLIMPVILAPTYNVALLATPVLFIILYFIALRRYLATLKPITDEVRSSFGQLNTHLTEALDGIETVKGASQEKEEVRRFSDNVLRYRDASVHQGDVEARFLPLLLLSVALAAGLFHALVLFHQGLLNVGQVVSYFGLLLLLDFPTFTSLFAYSRISLGLAGARRILELMQRENNLDQNIGGYAEPMRGEIEFRHVTFEYQPGDVVLEDISFKVKPGQTVAIVGQTGFGKTTLARLVNRTYDVTSGQVLVDGVDVRDWNLEALRRSISIIEQDIFLFSRSISDNIAFGRPGASEMEISAAGKAAQVEEFVSSFAEKYKTVIGERGVTLSGGQRQRLALARAFLTDPRILILDDSTSAIDSATEDKIQRAIYRAARGRTTLIITHRLSQIRWADLILVMRKGRLTALGTHEELLRVSEPYRRIFS
ncbi:MAG: ABC transporter ATP-binding protein/permease [Chloroflexi bacterium]|nr:ABC transporter ATP-binding protein/permease [Chloroflexota bacterium]